MKKFKAILALLLVACLFVTLFAACAKDPGTSTPNTDTNTNTNTDTKPDDAKDDDGAADAGGSDVDFSEDPIPIRFFFYDLRSKGADYSGPAEELIHKIALEKANLDVDVEWVTSGNWTNAVTLAISGGEVLDVIATSMGANAIAGQYAAGTLMDIKPYLETVGAETLELMKEYINVASFQGGIYGVPALRNYCKNGYILMNAEILDELGLRDAALAADSFSDVEAIFEAVKTNKNDIWAFGSTSAMWSDNYVSNGDNFADYDVYDNLGDGRSLIYCKDDGKVSSIVYQPQFEAECAMVKEWFDKGYVWPDSLISGSGFQDDLMKQKTLFSIAVGSELGVEVTKKGAYGYEVIPIQLCTGMVKTSQPGAWGCAVPITCEEPEAAVRFINLMYTDAELMNAMIWGVEGVDYTRDADGLIVSTGNYLEADFLIGNNTLLTPLSGNGVDFYERVKATNASAKKSPFLGFAFDTTGLDNLVSALTAVNDQYRLDLIAGSYSPEEYADWVAKLEVAGLKEYIDLFQTQLDAWKAG